MVRGPAARGAFVPVLQQDDIPTYQVLGLRPLRHDRRRFDETSVFFRRCLDTLDEVERAKAEWLEVVDFTSIQARDGALLHNEAAAAIALAFLRFCKAEAGGAAGLLDELGRISEQDLVTFMLLHDLGKYATDPALLNEASLGQDGRMALIGELQERTAAALEQLDRQDLVGPLKDFYRFEQARGAVTEATPLTLIAALADTYDALAAPKIYKGRPWSIPGILEELLRMPCAQGAGSALVRRFVELMRPEAAPIQVQARAGKRFK